MRKPISFKMMVFLGALTLLVSPILLILFVSGFFMFIAHYVIGFAMCLLEGKSLKEAHYWVMDDAEALENGFKHGGL
jgi:hypothetical protein